MENRYKAIRYFAYTVEILVVFMLQQTPGLFPYLLGARPVVLIPVALSIAMFESETAAMGFGLLCGLLIDFGMGSTLGFHGLLLCVFCYSIGILVINLLRTNLLTAFLLAGVVLGITFTLQWVFFYILSNYSYISYAFFAHYLPRFFYTLVFVPITYYFNRAFALLIRPQN